MEYLYLALEIYNFMYVYYLMESLTTLRASLVTQLLEQCSSEKVRRMFLYMTENVNHQWFRLLDLNDVKFCSGPRSFAKGSVTVVKYNIIVSKGLVEYE